MTITNIIDLEKFLRSSDGLITPAKIHALRVAARQFEATDPDLHQTLVNLAQALLRAKASWQIDEAFYRLDEDEPLSCITLRLNENSADGHYYLEVELSARCVAVFGVPTFATTFVTPNNPEWAPKRFQSGDANLYRTLNASLTN